MGRIHPRKMARIDISFLALDLLQKYLTLYFNPFLQAGRGAFTLFKCGMGFCIFDLSKRSNIPMSSAIGLLSRAYLALLFFVLVGCAVSVRGASRREAMPLGLSPYL